MLPFLAASYVAGRIMLGTQVGPNLCSVAYVVSQRDAVSDARFETAPSVCRCSGSSAA
jgi:hypothetical protein